MQHLGAQVRGGLGGPFGVVLQIDVRLNRVHAPDAALFGCALEDPGIVWHNQPQIGAAGIVAVPESFEDRSGWVSRHEHGGGSERGERGEHPGGGKPGRCVLDTLLAEHITDESHEGITGPRSDVPTVHGVPREAVGLLPGVE
jgi:hypothetical protein